MKSPIRLSDPPPRLSATTARPNRRGHHAGWRFVAPSAAFLVLVTIVPIVFLLTISLFDYQLGMPLGSARFVGIRYYEQMASGQDTTYWTSVKVTLYLAVATTVLNLLLGLAIATGLDRMARLRAPFTIAMIMPMVIAPAVVGMIWSLLYNDSYGLINAVLRELTGWAPNWLGDAQLAPVSIIIVEVWEWTPFVALILLAGLQGIPTEPLEAAKVDGAGAVRTFWSITLPLLRPIIFLVALLRVIDTLKLFDMVYVLTGGGPGSSTETVGLKIFNLSLHTDTDVGRAAAVSVTLIFIIFSLSLVVLRFLKRAEGQSQ